MRIDGAVVVVTGASSGIGRETALELSRRGANVVLAARREPALELTAAACAELGADTLVVPTDIAEQAAVEHLSERALEHFGRIDAWVANAGVYLVGRLDQTPPDAFRRVLEVNFLGAV